MFKNEDSEVEIF